MTVGIMQPYFLPYIGYFQLIHAVDEFVIYNNIEYTKKGWINRNRILQHGKDAYITLPLEKAADHLHVVDRCVANDFNKTKLLNQLKGSYAKAPFFKETYALVEEIISFDDFNLFAYIYNSVKQICCYLQIDTNMHISSTINIDHGLKGKDKVLALCERFKADTYINAIGGIELYDKQEFLQKGIELKFIKTQPVIYNQFENNFIPYLSIMDVLMFNSVDEVKIMLNKYDLI